MGNWQLGSGNRTDYDFFITSAFFGPDANYQNGETTLLILNGLDGDGQDVREIYNVGKDWISPDGGRSVQSTKGNKVIPRNTNYGKFIEAFLQLGPDVFAAFDDRGDANEARVWIGACFHMNEAEFSWGRGLDPTYKNVPETFLGWIDPETNEFTETDIPVEKQVNGSNGSSTPAKATPVKKAAPAKAPAAKAVAPAAPQPASSRPGGTTPAKAMTPQARAKAAIAAAKTDVAVAATSNGSSSDLFNTLVDLAKAADSFESFVNEAAEYEGLTDDEELSNVVFDPSDGGFYALQHA